MQLALGFELNFSKVSNVLMVLVLGSLVAVLGDPGSSMTTIGILYHKNFTGSQLGLTNKIYFP